MLTAFMLALRLTTVPHALMTMAIAPLLTALIARVALGHRLPLRTWVTIAVAGSGIAWMCAKEVSGTDPRHLLGSAIALAVPAAAAINWSVIQHSCSAADHDVIGALLSALATLPLALPFAGSTHDNGLLALRGRAVGDPLPDVGRGGARVERVGSVVARAARDCVDVALAWLGGHEAPAAHVLGGGLLVVAALAANEALALRKRAP